MHYVSIITPTYNSSQFIRETINSIMNQTYTNWELLITDDCSTDNTWEIIDGYAKTDNRIKIFRLDKNYGAAIARNNSIRKAKGRFIAFCDSDDMWKPKKLEKQLKFLLDNDYVFTFCQSEIMDEYSNIIGIYKRIPKTSYHKTLIINHIGTSGVFYDTKDIGKMYMSDTRRRQDWTLWLDILKKVKYAYCYPEPLSIWRKNQVSLSSDKGKLLKYHVAVYNKYIGRAQIISILIFYFISLPCIIIKKIKQKIDSTIYVRNKHNI